MKLKFSIEYHTQWGENMFVSLTYLGIDGSSRSSLLAMDTTDGQQWSIETAVLESRRNKMRGFYYHYEVRDTENKLVRSEWTLIERIMSFDDSRDYILIDSWRDAPIQQHLLTKCHAATAGLAVNERARIINTPLYRRTLVFRVHAPQLTPGQSVAICGSHPAIGGWSESRYIVMSYAGQSLWQITVNAAAFPLPVEYKYVVVDENSKELIRWEEGENRTTGEHAISEGGVLVLDGGIIRIKEENWRVAGVCIPLFSLRSNQSFGTGDFHDLRLFIHWAAEAGIKVIQLLPINDTTSTHGWTDSHPYNIISTKAIHPHYLSLYDAGKLQDKQLANAFERRRQELEAMPECDYEAVERAKWNYVKQLFNENFHNISENADFQLFCKENKDWLEPYIAFCLLRDTYQTSCYDQWPGFEVYHQDSVATFLKEHTKEGQLIGWVQYLLDRQLREAMEEAHQHQIALKGDLPVGVCRYSVETWTHPELFQLEATVGTPPDEHYRYGQNWGFPPYHWPQLMKDNAQWWKSRIRWFERYFDAIRVDHIAGFFRLWQIPKDAVQASLGHFVPALALSASEIEHMGLTFHKDFLTKPYINEPLVHRIFGIHASFVREHYLVDKGYGMLALCEELDTQQKIQAFFEGMNDEISQWIKDGLMRLAANVLFVKDQLDPDFLHPRIGAFREPVFQALGEEEQEAFMRIYRHYFHSRNTEYWISQASEKLGKIFSDTSLLICAEDLGFMPPHAEEVIDRLRILSLELQQMPKNDTQEFAPLGANPLRSVATTSTHDQSPLRLWWQENYQQAQRYFTTMLQKDGRAPRQLTVALAEEIIARHLYCPSMLCIFPIQDLLAMDNSFTTGIQPYTERINVPGDCYNRWQYRMNVSLEQLQLAHTFNQKILRMIQRSQRK